MHRTFIQRCANENPDDPRLRATVVPVVFETHGAAGPEACAMFAMVRHQFSNVALPCEDKSSESIFFSAWMHRVSTTLQRGTALMIYNIARGNTTKQKPEGQRKMNLNPRMMTEREFITRMHPMILRLTFQKNLPATVTPSATGTRRASRRQTQD